MLSDIGHPFARGEPVYDLTFENVQAGLRTDYLFRLANRHNGIVIGTGDLSELALGWCTYGVGDQMAHYNVNAGVPKTLIQHLIRWVIGSRPIRDGCRRGAGQPILETEITPELVPTEEGEQPQSTEATVGPYALQDFSLFQALRYGFRPSKVAFLALHAWSEPERGQWPPGSPNTSDRRTRLRRSGTGCRCSRNVSTRSPNSNDRMPNGPKVSHGGSLSPRGDWRAPSDMSARTWLDEIEREVPED